MTLSVWRPEAVACPAATRQLFTDDRCEEDGMCGALYCAFHPNAGQHYHGHFEEPLAVAAPIFVSDPDSNQFREYIYCPESAHLPANDRFNRHGHFSPRASFDKQLPN